MAARQGMQAFTAQADNPVLQDTSRSLHNNACSHTSTRDRTARYLDVTLPVAMGTTAHSTDPLEMPAPAAGSCVHPSFPLRLG